MSEESILHDMDSNPETSTPPPAEAPQVFTPLGPIGPGRTVADPPAEAPKDPDAPVDPADYASYREVLIPAGGLDELARTLLSHEGKAPGDPDPRNNPDYGRQVAEFEQEVPKRVMQLYNDNRDRLRDPGSHQVGQTARVRI